MDEWNLFIVLHAKLAWIDSLHPHRGIRADGEAISILSAKDGHLQGTHTHTKTQQESLCERDDRNSPRLREPEEPKSKMLAKQPASSPPWMVKWIIKNCLDSSFPIELDGLNECSKQGELREEGSDGGRMFFWTVIRKNQGLCGQVVSWSM